MARARRHAILTRLLTDHPSMTQEELADALHREGEDVTQTTVSRDLTSLGALRGPTGYTLPDMVLRASGTATGRGLERSLREHAVGVERAATQVVVRTAPGHAGVVASELDAARPAGMVGCVAGDDTILIATESAKAATQLAANLTSYLGAA